MDSTGRQDVEAHAHRHSTRPRWRPALCDCTTEASSRENHHREKSPREKKGIPSLKVDGLHPARRTTRPRGRPREKPPRGKTTTGWNETRQGKKIIVSTPARVGPPREERAASLEKKRRPKKPPSGTVLWTGQRDSTHPYRGGGCFVPLKSKTGQKVICLLSRVPL